MPYAAGKRRAPVTPTKKSSSRMAGFSVGSDEARVLDAMREARFSVWRIEGHHEIAGLVLTDVLRGGETWLVDEALASCARPGLAFASRLCWPAEFAITCGVVVPVDRELLTEVVFDCEEWLRTSDDGKIAGDPRFATSLYRAAIPEGVMRGVEFRDSAAAA